MKTNRGATLFRKWRKASGRSQRIVGEKLGIAPNTVTAYECGVQRPGLARAVEIEKLTDGEVKPAHWLIEESEDAATAEAAA